jgi:RimJ/RimL family protein N-acetyltransferase
MKNLIGVILKTERLILRPISFNQKDNIFSEFTDKVTRFMFPSAPKELADTEKFIKSSVGELEKGTDLVLSIFNKENDDFLGVCGLHRLNTKTPELGIWIKESAHGNKYGREAVVGLRDWANKSIKYEYLLYPVAKENIPSRKIAIALGGKEIKEFVAKKANGEDMVEVEYRIYR